ncbi:hypothetical protein HZB07_00270 [Candidatus Saganbacteria bacterium]|nr:hypothetical protein [Candidatus Saganbacteria bacterium]
MTRSCFTSTWTSALHWLGYAERAKLAAQLRREATQPDQSLLLEQLVKDGILKSRFGSLPSLGDIKEHMLRGATPHKLEGVEPEIEIGFNFDRTELFGSHLEKIVRAGYSWIIYSDSSMPHVISSSLKSALAIAAVVTGVAWLGVTVPLSFPTVMAGLTAICAFSAKVNTAIPAEAENSAAGYFWRGAKISTNLLARTFSPIVYAIDGYLLTRLFVNNHLNIGNVFDQIGPGGRVALLSGLGSALHSYLKINFKLYTLARGGQLDPGEKDSVKMTLALACLSNTAEVNYFGTRLLLWGAAAAFVFLNLSAAVGNWAYLPMAVPAVAFMATMATRYYYKPATYSSTEWVKFIDSFKVWGNTISLAGGLATACVVGYFTSSLIVPVAAATILGSFMTLFFSELHGVFHTFNTSSGNTLNQMASAHDPLGEMEIKRLFKNVRVLFVNPHTGVAEHVYGLLFGALLNRLPDTSFLCMYDRILNAGNSAQIANELDLVANVKKLQQEMFDSLHDGVADSSTLEEKYQKLIANLRKLARKLEDTSEEGIRGKIFTLEKKPYFETRNEVAFGLETRRACLEELSKLALELQGRADKLEAQLDNTPEKPAQISEDDFYSNWHELLHRYDPEFVTITVATRKAIAGDDMEIRKVENVCSLIRYRGTTFYRLEVPGAARGGAPNEDWIIGNWTEIDNPNFRYDALPTDPAEKRARRIWIRRGNVAFGIQNSKRPDGKSLLSDSTSPIVESIDNTPTEAENFKIGTQPARVEINEESVTIAPGDYYVNPDDSAVPSIRSIVLREGKEAQDLNNGHRLAINGKEEATVFKTPDSAKPREIIPTDKQPKVSLLSVRHVKDATMLNTIDKNDVPVNPMLLAALLKLCEEDTHLQLMLRFPLGLIGDTKYCFANSRAHQAGAGNVKQCEPVVAGLELSVTQDVTDKDGNQVKQEFVIPYVSQRDQVHVGLKPDVSDIWPALRQAVIKIVGGAVEKFTLIYRGIVKAKFLAKFGQGIISLAQLEKTFEKTNGQAIWEELKKQKYLEADNETGIITNRFIQRPVRFDLGGALSVFNHEVEKLLLCAPRGIDVWDALTDVGMLEDEKVEGELKGETLAMISEKYDPDTPSAIAGLDEFDSLVAPAIRIIVQDLFKNGVRTLPVDPPQYWRELYLPDGKHTLRVNNQMRNPYRWGDAIFVKMTYEDGLVAFARCRDGEYPLLNNKPQQATATSTPIYYKVETRGGEVVVSDVRLSRGMMVHVPPGWAQSHEAKIGQKIVAVNDSGDVYLDPHGNLSPVPVEGGEQKNYKGRMLGMVHTYDRDQDGKLISQDGKPVCQRQIVVFDDNFRFDRKEIAESVIEIVPSGREDGMLDVIRRKRPTVGLFRNQSLYIYNLTEEATQKIEAKIGNISWIRRVDVSRKGVVVHYCTPEAPKESKRLTLGPSCFTDNDNRILLDNHQAEMSSQNDFYQSACYTPETRRYAPRIDLQDGVLRLYIHRVEHQTVACPEKLTTHLTANPGQRVTIAPAWADAAAQVSVAKDKTVWVPITLTESARPEGLGWLIGKVFGKDARVESLSQQFDPTLSSVRALISSVIGPQTRFGENNNISSENPRDPYFYGLVVKSLPHVLMRMGEIFAINRQKGLRGRAVESGRTHTMSFRDVLKESVVDVLGTNNPNWLKVCDFLCEFGPPGVSEDTQKELSTWLKGLRMWAIRETVMLAAAEKELGRYDTQDSKRYNLSTALFYLPFILAATDLLRGRFLGTRPITMAWGEISEVSAGRTWYFDFIAQIVKHLGIPVYLGSAGHILPYPVDLSMFTAAWLFRTMASSMNYGRQLLSLGYGLFSTGLWRNPIIGLSLLAGFMDRGMNQFLLRQQYCYFIMTTGATGEVVPKVNRRLLTGLGLSCGLSVAGASMLLMITGAVGCLALPLGIAAIPVAISLLGKTTFMKQGWQKTAARVGIGLLAASGIALGIVGLPALISALNIAIMANVGFGLYSAAQLWGARRYIRQAEKELEIHTKRNTSERHNYYRDLDREQTFLLRAARQTAAKETPSYEELQSQREELWKLLQKIDGMDEHGNIHQGIAHPYRYAIYQILDVLSGLEMTIAAKAERDMNVKASKQTAQEYVINLLATSKEFIITQQLLQICRRHGIRGLQSPSKWIKNETARRVENNLPPLPLAA